MTIIENLQHLDTSFLTYLKLRVAENIVLRSSRVFISVKFRERVMDELHYVYQGISTIKACSCVWWPGIDRDLETKVLNCLVCQRNAPALSPTHISWFTPDRPWERIHIDHAFP